MRATASWGCRQMSRTADYTIQGFLYQFDTTLLEILKAADDAVVTVEGIIEDIEVAGPLTTTAIQCKYHEASEKFVLSNLYEPLLQMMSHFHSHPDLAVNYVLFAHFPDQPDGSTLSLDRETLQVVLASKNKGLKKYISVLKDKIDLDAFLTRVTCRFGPSIDDVRVAACKLLEAAGFSAGDVEELAYPNALQAIAMMSARHDVAERKITRGDLVDRLHKIKTTAVSRWTLALKSRKQILDAKRRQLAAGLKINSRARLFVIFHESLSDFEDECVSFIDDYLQKYHCKPAHISTPVFSIDVPAAELRDVQRRLFVSKSVVATDGRLGGKLFSARFLRQPMKRKQDGKEQAEFSLRLIGWNGDTLPVLRRCKPKDVFVLGVGDLSKLKLSDVNVEILEADSLKEIKYMMGVSNAYE